MKFLWEILLEYTQGNQWDCINLRIFYEIISKNSSGSVALFGKTVVILKLYFQLNVVVRFKWNCLFNSRDFVKGKSAFLAFYIRVFIIRIKSFKNAENQASLKNCAGARLLSFKVSREFLSEVVVRRCFSKYVFYCENSKIFKNAFFTEHLRWQLLFFLIKRYTAACSYQAISQLCLWLTHFIPLVSFYASPKNRQKTFGFLIFLGGLERDQWHEMD